MAFACRSAAALTWSGAEPARKEEVGMEEVCALPDGGRSGASGMWVRRARAGAERIARAHEAGAAFRMGGREPEGQELAQSRLRPYAGERPLRDLVCRPPDVR